VGQHCSTCLDRSGLNCIAVLSELKLSVCSGVRIYRSKMSGRASPATILEGQQASTVKISSPSLPARIVSSDLAPATVGSKRMPDGLLRANQIQSLRESLVAHNRSVRLGGGASIHPG
jgi:hypothetical protein